MNRLGTFPFGQPVLPVVQRGRGKMRVFILGVYSSAVHACWVSADGCRRISAVAVASEPEIFWRGDATEAHTIIAGIKLPTGGGRLIPANAQLNGPSGKALDDLFLQPLGLSREDAWLCDLVPHSCMNEKQELALKREYDGLIVDLGLPQYDWPRLPDKLATEQRRREIEAELNESAAEVLITLGDQPLRWFTSHYGSKTALSEYGCTSADYGHLHPLSIGGRDIKLLPLVHPRQAAKLGSHSSVWFELHKQWVGNLPQDVFLT